MAISYIPLHADGANRYPVAAPLPRAFFVSSRELVAMRHLLMQESGKLTDRCPPRFFESPAMSATQSTILVVEDDAIVRMLIVDVLEELEYKVVEADGSEQALEVLQDQTQQINLMMTDVGLPGMDGRELAKEARRLRPALKVLFASGYAESIDVPDDMHMIGKPFSIDQLRDQVKKIID